MGFIAAWVASMLLCCEAPGAMVCARACGVTKREVKAILKMDEVRWAEGFMVVLLE
jgi:hypothetical protein